MKVTQIVKKLNNTEIGKGNTHETYVLVQSDMDVSDIFDTPNEIMNFKDKVDGENVRIRLTVGREKRIVGLGDFYRKHDAKAGDELLFEKIETVNHLIQYNIFLNKANESVVLQKCKNGFELLSDDTVQFFSEHDRAMRDGRILNIALVYMDEIRKRSDSPNTTPIYDLQVGGVSVNSDYSGKEMVEVSLIQNSTVAMLNRVCAWQKYFFETED